MTKALRHPARLCARVGLGYHALGVLDGDIIVWFWIDTRADYDQLRRTL